MPMALVMDRVIRAGSVFPFDWKLSSPAAGRPNPHATRPGPFCGRRMAATNEKTVLDMGSERPRTVPIRGPAANRPPLA